MRRSVCELEDLLRMSRDLRGTSTHHPINYVRIWYNDQSKPPDRIEAIVLISSTTCPRAFTAIVLVLEYTAVDDIDHCLSVIGYPRDDAKGMWREISLTRPVTAGIH